MAWVSKLCLSLGQTIPLRLAFSFILSSCFERKNASRVNAPKRSAENDCASTSQSSCMFTQYKVALLIDIFICSELAYRFFQ